MKVLFAEYGAILAEEIIIAQGCTEPIAGAYVGAVAKSYCTDNVKEIEIIASKNIVKNAKGVNIPNGEQLKGIEASVTLGVIGGDPQEKMEVLKNITSKDVKQTIEMISMGKVKLKLSSSPAKLHIIVNLIDQQNNHIFVEVMHSHTNITKIIKNKQIIFEKPVDPEDFFKCATDRSQLNVKNIIEFTKNVDLKVLEMVEKQLTYNVEIANEGLKNNYGISVGKSNFDKATLNLKQQAAAFAAAGSDARMAGNTLPVAIISGSGNQGMTSSLPVYIYAKHLEVSPEKMLRAVTLSDLIAIHIKGQVGKLSPLCGASIAAIGAGCGILYLKDATYEQYTQMITNNIATNMGMICDGAKGSCALKIYSAVQTSITCAELAMKNHVVGTNEGIIGEDVEATIRNLGKVAKAMNPIDDVIMEIMN